VSQVSFSLRRRLSALGAFGALGIGVCALGLGVRDSPFAILITLVCLLAAIGFGWVALTRQGRDREVAGWLAAVLLAVGFVAAIGGDTDLWVMVLGGVAIATALPLGRYALGRDRRSLAEMTPPGSTVPAARRAVLLVNPLSGDGKADRIGLLDHAAARGIECHPFGPGVDVRALAEQAVAGGADVVGVAGGDGSQAVVADVVSRAGVAMVVIPAGTRNHFAMDLGLDRSEPLAGLDAFGEARERVVDLARVNGQAFLNNVSMGLYGEVVQQATYRERKLQTAIAELPAIVETPPDLRFTGPDGLPHATVQVVHVSNNPYLLDVRGAGGRPRLNSGQLGIVTAELSSAAGVTEMFARAAVGLLASATGLNAWSAERFVVESDAPIAAGVDGEAAELTSPAVFEIEPAALRVRIPPDAIGRSPAAFVPQFRQAFAELFRRAFLPVRAWRPLPRR
jgi:diacylglycerol kinase family enzyme